MKQVSKREEQILVKIEKYKNLNPGFGEAKSEHLLNSENVCSKYWDMLYCGFTAWACPPMPLLQSKVSIPGLKLYMESARSAQGISLVLHNTWTLFFKVSSRFVSLVLSMLKNFLTIFPLFKWFLPQINCDVAHKKIHCFFTKTFGKGGSSSDTKYILTSIVYYTLPQVMEHLPMYHEEEEEDAYHSTHHSPSIQHKDSIVHPQVPLRKPLNLKVFFFCFSL